MKIDLTEIYKGLKAWRHERGITADSQKAGYLVNVMEEFGELASALRDYEKFSAADYPYPTDKQEAEHEIIDAICDICVFTINAEADIPYSLIPFIIETKREFSVADIFVAIADFIRADNASDPGNLHNGSA